MSLEPEANKVTPLSQGLLINRSRSNHFGEEAEEKPITEAKLREVLSDFANDFLVAKFKRLENSLNKLAEQFEAIHNGTSEDASLRVTTDPDAADIAIASIQLPKEHFYPYTCKNMAEILQVRQHDVLQMIKNLNLRNDPEYNINISVGKSGINKWSQKTLLRLEQALKSGEYKLPN
ncbi:hypothetical protein [Nostoc sp.]|uniref:hypothetical protein n=1 Tax=Nostoc sp. TaxID=1180 RepID=UPI002FF64F59